MEFTKDQLITILQAMDCYNGEMSRCPEEYNSIVYAVAKELDEKYSYPVWLTKDYLGNFRIRFDDPYRISLFEFSSNIKYALSDYKDRYNYQMITPELVKAIEQDMNYINNEVQKLMPNGVTFQICADLRNSSICITFIDNNGNVISELEDIFIDRELAKDQIRKIKKYLHI